MKYVKKQERSNKGLKFKTQMAECLVNESTDVLSQSFQVSYQFTNSYHLNNH
jgi:hypothetical protein